MNDGGPAFPVPGETGGMSLRDYFAAKAMAARIANPAFVGVTRKRFRSEKAREDWRRKAAAAHASRAYIVADAMLEERARHAT